MSTRTAQDGRLTAHANEVAVLRALHRFGWLRTRDLAALVWNHWAEAPAAAPTLAPVRATASQQRMAQRTLKRLRARREVLQSAGPDGSILYALAEAGVRTLRTLGFTATSGKDLMRAFSNVQFCHRCIANEIAISAILEGFRVSTERETARGLWMGGREGIGGKVPDVLIQHAGAAWWVEVEHSRKNARDYANLLAWLSKVRHDRLSGLASQLLGKKMRWERVTFVCTDSFRRRLAQDLVSAGWPPSDIQMLIGFSTTLYQMRNIYFRA